MRYLKVEGAEEPEQIRTPLRWNGGGYALGSVVLRVRFRSSHKNQSIIKGFAIGSRANRPMANLPGVLKAARQLQGECPVPRTREVVRGKEV